MKSFVLGNSHVSCIFQSFDISQGKRATTSNMPIQLIIQPPRLILTCAFCTVILKTNEMLTYSPFISSLSLSRAAQSLTPSLPHRCSAALFLVLFMSHQVELAAAAARLFKHDPDIFLFRIPIRIRIRIPLLLLCGALWLCGLTSGHPFNNEHIHSRPASDVSTTQIFGLFPDSADQYHDLFDCHATALTQDGHNHAPAA